MIIAVEFDNDVTPHEIQQRAFELIRLWRRPIRIVFGSGEKHAVARARLEVAPVVYETKTDFVLPVGGRVLIVHPVTARADDWDAPWTQLVRRRSAQWGAALAADKRFEVVRAVPPTYRRATRIGVRGVIYEKKTE